ncbi:MAG TPA: SprB repeat-containing protein, partial [Bacteroidia bacterium]|nr:SprB repeat-containing protein [Bacteroidia bacterium]
MRSSSGEPWVNNNNVTLMNTAFGSSGWILGTFQNTAAATVFNNTTKLVFMDGSNLGATALNNYLISNGTVIENWVSNGGMLFINAAPDQGGNFGLGFGGVMLNFNTNYNKASNNASISSGQNTHQIFTGPNACGTSWTGVSFAHATITGGAATPLITGNKGTVLAEKISGYGRVLFGTMTLASFHSPQPNATNLRLNIFAYLNNNAPFIVQCTSTNASCIGNNNGSVSVSVLTGGTTPFTYLWN